MCHAMVQCNVPIPICIRMVCILYLYRCTEAAATAADHAVCNADNHLFMLLFSCSPAENCLRWLEYIIKLWQTPFHGSSSIIILLYAVDVDVLMCYWYTNTQTKIHSTTIPYVPIDQCLLSAIHFCLLVLPFFLFSFLFTENIYYWIYLWWNFL